MFTTRMWWILLCFIGQPVMAKPLGFFVKTSEQTHIYRNPNLQNKSASTLAPNVFVRAVEKRNGFYGLEVNKGSRLWVQKSEVRILRQTGLVLRPISTNSPVALYQESKHIRTPRILASEESSGRYDWESDVGRCLLPKKLEAQMVKDFDRGMGYQNFADKRAKFIKKTMALGLSSKSKLAFDQYFILGPHGWLRWSAQHKDHLKSLPEVEKMVMVDALARTMWAEMEDAAFFEGEHYFEAVARVILNRAREIEGNTIYKTVFDNRRHPFVYSKWDQPVLRAVRSAKQFSCWNNATPNRRKVYHSLLRTLCPKVGMNPQTQQLWRMAVDISKAAIFDRPQFLARTERWTGLYYYTSQNVSLCSKNRPCDLKRDMASNKKSHQRIKPKYLTFWKVKKRAKKG